MKFNLQPLTENDIDTIVTAFARINWNKPRTTFEQYLREQEAGLRSVWVAFVNGQFAGYITLCWSSLYKPFRQKNIPEIMDLNVLPGFRNKGIGTALLDAAEVLAYSKHEIVGLGAGLYPDYGSAQRLYIKRGYLPDGLGVTYNYERIEPGKSVILDDDLILWFTKSKTGTSK